jgi:hypothetical protein
LCHIFWFHQAMKVHEYTLERSWSRAYNATGVECFRHSSEASECF